MNRRTLLGMVLGAFSGVSLPKVAWAAVERNLTPAEFEAIEDQIDVSEARAILAASNGERVAWAAITTKCGSAVPIGIHPPFCQCEISARGPLTEQLPYPQVKMGSLIIRNEAEAKAFLKQMGEAIAAAAKRRRNDGSFSF